MSRIGQGAHALRQASLPWTNSLLIAGSAIGAVKPLFGLIILVSTLTILRPSLGSPVAGAFAILFACLLAVRRNGPDTRYANNLSVIVLVLLTYVAYEALRELRDSRDDV